MALEEAVLGVALDPTTKTPSRAQPQIKNSASKHRTGVAVPRKNTVPQNRYDGKADDSVAADQIRSEN